MIKKSIQMIDRATDILSGLLQGWIVFFLMVMVLVEVLTRYILQSPLSIADELGGYLLVSVTFLGLAYTWKEGGHVRVELLVNLLPPKVGRFFRFITLVMAAVFCIPMIMGSYSLLQDSLLFETRSGSWLRTPLVYPQSLLLIGSVLLAVQLAAEILKSVFSLSGPKEEEE